MSFCSKCGKPTPCGVVHAKGKPTARSQNFAKQRNQGSNAKPLRGLIARNANAPSTSRAAAFRAGWTVHGPDARVIFPGSYDVCHLPEAATVSQASSSTSSTFFSIIVKDFVAGCAGKNLFLHSVVVRFTVSGQPGVIGVVEKYNSSTPAAPSSLNRRRFGKDRAMGVQFIAPSDYPIDCIPEDTRIVLKFDAAYPVSTELWRREAWIITSKSAAIRIPPDVLSMEKVPASNT